MKNSALFVGDYRAGRGRNSDAVPSPYPLPAWGINNMASKEESRCNMY